MKSLGWSVLMAVVLLGLMACEAQKQMSVAVYDQHSKHPLDSVQVTYKAGKAGDYSKSGAQGQTDSTGRWKTSFMIGCSFGCYDILVEFHKKGYAPLTVFQPKDSSVVYLMPL